MFIYLTVRKTLYFSWSPVGLATWKSVGLGFKGLRVLSRKMGDRAMLHRLWEKWALPFISVAGDQPLTGATLINVSPDRPSRFYSLIVEQEGLSFKASDVRPIVEGVRDNCLHSEYFYIGADKYWVTTVLENVYCARCLNSRNPAGCGVIISRHAPFIIIATYQGGICAACKAAAIIETLLDQLLQTVC